METRSTTRPTLDEAFIRDPYPRLAELRRDDPIHWDESLQTWVVTRHSDVKALFADPRLSRDRKSAAHYRAPAPGSWAYRFDHEGFANAEPEAHKRWRRSISAGFTPRAVARMQRQVVDVVEQFAAPLRGRSGVVDLVAEFTNPIPNTVISRMTGIPPYPGDEDRFRRLAQDVIRRFFLYADEANMRRGELAIEELAEWVGKLADQRRQEPREDMLSDLIHGNQGDFAMSNDEMVMLVAALVAAGSETTTLGGTHILRLLLEHPEQLALLREQPELATNAVREALRFGFGSGAAGSPRFALEDIELHGQTIRAGQMLMLNSSSAHRDESVFPDPDRFDITRDTREIVVFGNGPHYCLGANLAMQELTCMLEAALDFLPAGAQLRRAEVAWENIGLMRRPVNLPVDFG